MERVVPSTRSINKYKKGAYTVSVWLKEKDLLSLVLLMKPQQSFQMPCEPDSAPALPQQL